MHKARDNCDSTVVNPPSQREPSVPGAAGKTVEKQAELQIQMTTEMRAKTTPPEPIPSTSAEVEPAPTAEGKAGVDWFKVQLMYALHDMDGEDSVFEHLDRKILEAIAKDEFVDFRRLLEKEEVKGKGLSMCSQEGVEFYFLSNKPPPEITGFGEWCKAFLIFQAAHQKFHPERAQELLEYRASIEEFAKQFPWHKVAEYDCKFRRNMAKKPWRHWGLINQLWRARILVGDDERGGKPPKTSDKEQDPKGGKNKNKKKGLCRQWNSSGECKFGTKCFYEHRCAICGKQGHGAFNCHKLKSGGNHTGAENK